MAMKAVSPEMIKDLGKLVFWYADHHQVMSIGNFLWLGTCRTTPCRSCSRCLRGCVHCEYGLESDYHGWTVSRLRYTGMTNRVITCLHCRRDLTGNSLQQLKVEWLASMPQLESLYVMGGLRGCMCG